MIYIYIYIHSILQQKIVEHVYIYIYTTFYNDILSVYKWYTYIYIYIYIYNTYVKYHVGGARSCYAATPQWHDFPQECGEFLFRGMCRQRHCGGGSFHMANPGEWGYGGDNIYVYNINI